MNLESEDVWFETPVWWPYERVWPHVPSPYVAPTRELIAERLADAVAWQVMLRGRSELTSAEAVLRRMGGR